MKECKSFAELLKRINDGVRSVKLRDINLTSGDIEKLACIIRNNISLQEISLFFNCIGDEGVEILSDAIKINRYLRSLSLTYNIIKNKGAIALAELIKLNKYIKALYIYNNSIGDEGTKALDEAIFASPNILYSDYDNQSIQVMMELERRQYYIKSLIRKFKTQESSAFTILELMEFYNKKDSMLCVSQVELARNADSEYIINGAEFERDILSQFYARYRIVGVLLKQHLPKELQLHTSCFWMQLHVNSNISKIPALPRESIEERMIIDM